MYKYDKAYNNENLNFIVFFIVSKPQTLHILCNTPTN